MTDLIARCLDAEPCPGFEVVCTSAAHKERVEQGHMARWHEESAPTSDEVCDQMWTSHADERDAILLAIETDARMNNGEVSVNRVRGLLPRGLTPQLRGAVINRLLRDKRLEFVRKEPSTDTKGRNQNKDSKVYRWVPVHDRSVNA